jgi:hypothetical protein
MRTTCSLAYARMDLTARSSSAKCPRLSRLRWDKPFAEEFFKPLYLTPPLARG